MSRDDTILELLAGHQRLVGDLLEAYTAPHRPGPRSDLAQRALGLVAAQRARTVTDLAQKLGRSPATMSRAVTELVEQGLVARDADRQDRRLHLLAATEAGQRIVWDRFESLHDALEALDDADLAALAQGLRAVKHACASQRPG